MDNEVGGDFSALRIEAPSGSLMDSFEGNIASQQKEGEDDSSTVPFPVHTRRKCLTCSPVSSEM